MLANAPAAASNVLFGTEFPEQQANISRLLTDIGFPEAETGTERIVQDLSQAVAGGGGLIKGAQALGRGAQGVTQGALQSLTQAPGTQLAAEAAGAGAAGAARELDAGPGVQLAAGLAGGILGGVPVAAGPAAAGAVSSVFRKTQPNQISALFEDISEGGVDAAGAFGRLRSELGAEASKLQSEISGTFVDGQKVSPGLFDVAKERGQNAFVGQDVVQEFSNAIKQQAKEEFDDDAIKILGNASARLDDLIQAGPISLNDLEGLRRAASRISKGGGTKGFVGGDIARQIDTVIDAASASNKITGDQQAVNIWKQAISKRREFGQKFEQPKEIASSIGDDTMETVEKKFLGTGPISSKTELGNIYNNTLKALPEAQRTGAGFLLRQSVVNRMIKRASRTTDEEGVSANFMANQIRNLRTENKSMWDKFPSDEKVILNRLEKNLKEETKGGPLNIIGKRLFNFLGRASRSNLELPRTLKPKTIVTVDELLELTNIKPTFKSRARRAGQALRPVGVGATLGATQERN